MRRLLPHSLRGLLLTHEIALLLLVIVTAALSGLWTTFWAQASRESVRLNALLFNAQQIRGDLYSQLQLVHRAVRLGEAVDRIQYQQLEQRTTAGFADLERRLTDDQERVAADYMRRTYAVVKTDMARLMGQPSAQPHADRPAGNRVGLLDPLYEEWTLAEFESAQVIFARVLAARREALEQRMDTWSRWAPWTSTVPVVLAIVLVLLARLSLQARFVRPTRELVERVRQLGAHAATTRDIPIRGASEIVALDQAFRQLSADLSASRAALVASEKQAALGALVPVVAHNIRNPLASIRATAQLLDGEESPEELRDTRADIIASVDRLERWVSALLAYLHPLRPSCQTVRLTRVIEGALQPLAHRLAEKQLQCKRAPWPEDLTLEADPVLLEQALHGLLTNAVEASPFAAPLTVGVHADAGMIEIRLEDRGPGLPFAPEPNGLKPGPTTKRLGTGLGIPFAFKVIEAHDGQLIFDTRPGGGTRVRLRLPTTGRFGEKRQTHDPAHPDRR